MKNRAHRDGWWYPWIFVGGMGIVVIVNGFLAYFAVSTYSGLETEGHYEKGIAYNQNLAAAKAQREMGWHLTAAVTTESRADGALTGVVRATLQDRHDAPISKLTIRGILSRPTEQGLDQTLSLVETVPGTYEARVRFPKAGTWDLRVIASGGAVPYQEVRRLSVR